MRRAWNSTLAGLALAAAAAGCGTGGSGGKAGAAPPLSPPAITSVTPTAGAPGTAVEIRGTSFEVDPAQDLVFFGDTQAKVTSSDSGRIACLVPPGADPGATTIGVTTRAGTGASAAGAFTVG